MTCVVSGRAIRSRARGRPDHVKLSNVRGVSGRFSYDDRVLGVTHKILLLLFSHIHLSL